MWSNTTQMTRLSSLTAIVMLLSVLGAGFSGEWRPVRPDSDGTDGVPGVSSDSRARAEPLPRGRLEHQLPKKISRTRDERYGRVEEKRGTSRPRVVTIAAQEPAPSKQPRLFSDERRRPGESKESSRGVVEVSNPVSDIFSAQKGIQRLQVVQYNAVRLDDAMRLFSDETGINVICSAAAGKTEVTAYLRDVAPLDALEAIVKANGLFFREDDESEIVRISTTEEYEKDLTSFRDEQTRVFTLLYPNPGAVAQVIAQVFGDQVELNTADTDVADLDDLSQRFNRFDLVDGRALGLGTFEGSEGQRAALGGAGNVAGGAAVQGVLGRDPLSGSQSGRSRSRPRQGSRDRFPSDMTAAEIQNLENQLADSGDISETDRSHLMRRGEATIYVSTIRRNNQVVVRTGDPQSMSDIEKLVKQLDVPTATVLLEVKVLRIALAEGVSSAFEYFVGNEDGAVAFSDGSLAPAFPGASSASRIFANGLGISGSVPGALTFQVVDRNFQFRMQMLESESRVTALATPLILTANNEVSRIFVGDTLPFTIGFTPSQVVGGLNAGPSAVAATPITELRDVGQSLLITPSINADRTVTLRVVEENSERVLGGASIPIPDVNGSGVTAVQVDTVRRRTVSGTVVAQDGMAVALGGLIEEHDREVNDQVPGIGNVPGLGFLFRRNSASSTRSELVVVVRPHVFNTPSESAATTQAVLGDLSIHPNSQDAVGAMDAHLPTNVIHSDSECLERAELFQFHK